MQSLDRGLAALLLHGVASDRVVVAHGLLELDKNDSVGVLTLAPRYTTIEEECQVRPVLRLVSGI
jgi:hypothetical protein